MAYTVTSPLVVVRQANGGFVHVYEGGAVPEDSDKDHVKQLLDGGMIAEASDADTGDDEGGKPSARAGVDKWRAYAISQGVPEEEAAGLSKDEIRDRFPDE